jgi:hypothetical protein
VLSGLLFSDVTIGIEESLANLRKLQRKPGKFLSVFNKEFQADSGTFEGNELNSIKDGMVLFDRDSDRLLKDIISCTADRFEPLLSDPTLKAFTIFEVVKWPAFDDREALESFGEDEFEHLLKHFSTLFTYLGGDPEAAQRQWTRLKFFISRDKNLRSLKYRELWERMFDSYSDKAVPMHFYHALLVVLIGMVVLVDTSICERGFSAMNLLKTAKRSAMGNRLLRILMTICELGAEWQDPKKIPAAQILAIWRAKSERGRYEAKLWQPAALDELEEVETAAAGGRGNLQPDQAECEAEVDAAQDGGYFARFGEAAPQGRGLHAGVYRGTTRM